MSESLILLTKNERMSELLIFLVNRSFAHFLTKNERFARKSNERIPSPEIKQTGCQKEEKNVTHGNPVFRIHTVFIESRSGRKSESGSGSRRSLSPHPDPSYFLPLPGINIKLFYNHKIFPVKRFQLKDIPVMF